MAKSSIKLTTMTTATIMGRILYASLLILSLPFSAFACDPCALYNVSKLQGHSKSTIAVAISEQFTKFERLEIDNSANTEYTKGFSTSVFSASYDLSDNLGFQFNVPYIIRDYVKRERFNESGEIDSGVGDISLGANFSPYTYKKNQYSAILSLYGSIKFPTGDTGSISRSNTSARLAHHTAPISGATSGGRTLTIGTGSTDYIFGTSFSGRADKILWLSTVQYAIRTEGDFNYRFDNDIVWNAGPGAYLILKDEQTLALRAVFSGEHKGKDTLNGNKVDGSRISNLYLGPEIIATIKQNWIADLGLDIPVYSDKDDSTLAPDWRIRTSISYRF